jgi:hypothetical protein
MKHYFFFVLMATMAGCGMVRADSSAPSLKEGSWYSITMPKDMTLGENVYESSDYNRATVKIISINANQWCWVEFDWVILPRDNNGDDKKGQVVISKDRIWLNFAHVTTIRPAHEPDYKGYKDQYAGGVKVVAYEGP